MKKSTLLFLLIITGYLGFSQTPGISYQAVILNPNAKELPGINAQTNILANSKVAIRFTILDESYQYEYQEYHITNTDAYGMINLLIGHGNRIGSSYFQDILWNGLSKKLKVDIDFSGGGNNFSFLNEQELTFMPQPALGQDAQAILDNKASIMAEVSRATNAEETIKAAVDSNEAERILADEALQDSIDDLKVYVDANTIDIGNLTNSVSDINLEKANLASPSFIGTPLAPTAAAGTNNTQIATTAFVTDAIATAETPDATATVKGKIQLAGDLNGTAALPTIANAAVGTAKLADASVTTVKISDNAVTTAKINDGAIVSSKIAASPSFTGTPLAPTAAAGTNTTQIATTAFVTDAIATAETPDATATVKGKLQLAGDLTGTAALPTIANAAIGTSKLSDGAVTAAKIADGSVTEDKIGASAITTSKINDGAIVSSKIAASPSFTGTPLAPTAAAGTNTTQIATTAFVTDAIATAETPDATATVKGKLKLAGDLTGTAALPTIANAAVGTAKLADASVTSAKIADNAVTSAKIDDGAVVSSKIESSPSFTGTPLAPTAVSGTNTTQIATTAFVTDAIATAETPDATATVKGKIQLAGDLNGTAALPTIANAAVGTSKLADASVTSAKIADNAVTSAKIDDGAVVSSKIESSPSFTGIPLAPTAAAGTNTTQIATTAFVSNAVLTATAGNFVDLTTTQTIEGVKTFTKDVVVNGITIGRGVGDNEQNTILGKDALGTGTGTRNTAIGYGALKDYAGTSFDNNTSVGYFNLVRLTTGSGNTSVGAESMLYLLTGSSNTSIGNQSLINVLGNNNVGVGKGSGNVLTTGSNNTIIGAEANVLADDQTNSIAIGYQSVVTANNTIQLGNANITLVNTSGAITSGGAITGTSIVKVGGTSSQFLMADGSVSEGMASVREVADEYSATASQTSFTLTQTPAANSKVKMYVNGIRISNTAYNISGTTLTYIPANNGGYSFSASDRIQMDYYY